MSRTLVAVVASTSLLLLSTAAVAADAAASKAQPVSSHEQAVRELLLLMGVEQNMVAGASLSIDAQVQGNPALAPYRDVMLAWAKKYVTWDEMAPGLIDMYRSAFTESELREMVAFYKTPTGAKALSKMPQLMEQSAAIGMAVAQKHTPELEKMVEARRLELEGKPAGQ